MEGVANNAEGADRFRAEEVDRFHGRDEFGEPSITLQLKPEEKTREKIRSHLASPLKKNIWMILAKIANRINMPLLWSCS
ncbi:hypothetical protein HYC85_014388 [Camellia sinensis]|uniref:Uncharacterized protein n=1 Tax=Camellia sinensis TaxID=4442 RepID=A0A7J7H850_CAMSI|nr:hypothetical protein HYC85_014388 [Camellia sinensis]